MQKNDMKRQLFRTPFSRAYWHQAFSELKNTRSLVFAALILALRVAMKPVRIPIAADVNITFGFIVNAFGSMVYGPVVALLSGAVSDTLGYLVAPNGVYYFPFIILEMAGSFIFALFLYSTEVSVWRLILSKFCVNFLVNILLNEPIMVRYYQLFFTTAYQPFVWIRIVKNIVMLPFESLVLIVVFRGIMPPLSRMGWFPCSGGRLKLTKRHIALLIALFVIGAGAVTGYVIYDYNTRSFSASYTAAERLARNMEMNAWAAEEAGLDKQETVTIIQSARSKVGDREMTYEIVIYRIDRDRYEQKHEEAEKALAEGVESAAAYDMDTLNGYSKSKAAKDDTLIRIGEGTAIQDKKTGEKLSMNLIWDEDKAP